MWESRVKWDRPEWQGSRREWSYEESKANCKFLFETRNNPGKENGRPVPYFWQAMRAALQPQSTFGLKNFMPAQGRTSREPKLTKIFSKSCCRNQNNRIETNFFFFSYSKRGWKISPMDQKDSPSIWDTTYFSLYPICFSFTLTDLLELPHYYCREHLYSWPKGSHHPSWIIQDTKLCC